MPASADDPRGDDDTGNNGKGGKAAGKGKTKTKTKQGNPERTTRPAPVPKAKTPDQEAKQVTELHLFNTFKFMFKTMFDGIF